MRFLVIRPLIPCALSTVIRTTSSRAWYPDYWARASSARSAAPRTLIALSTHECRRVPLSTAEYRSVLLSTAEYPVYC